MGVGLDGLGPLGPSWYMGRAHNVPLLLFFFKTMCQCLVFFCCPPHNIYSNIVTQMKHIIILE